MYSVPDLSCDETLQPVPDDQQVRQSYRRMWLLRSCDCKAVSLHRRGRFGTDAHMEGQEGRNHPGQAHAYASTP